MEFLEKFFGILLIVVEIAFVVVVVRMLIFFAGVNVTVPLLDNLLAPLFILLTRGG